MSEWSGDVVNESHKLSDAQVNRLLKMTECLRTFEVLHQIVEIKMCLAGVEPDDIFEALALWGGFTEDEQVALWIAPTYGGIFTTEERKRLKPLTREED
jgi:hypothetical protein